MEAKQFLADGPLLVGNACVGDGLPEELFVDQAGKAGQVNQVVVTACKADAGQIDAGLLVSQRDEPHQIVQPVAQEGATVEAGDDDLVAVADLDFIQEHGPRDVGRVLPPGGPIGLGNKLVEAGIGQEI